jgi:hypothetical protein
MPPNTGFGCRVILRLRLGFRLSARNESRQRFRSEFGEGILDGSAGAGGRLYVGVAELQRKCIATSDLR